MTVNADYLCGPAEARYRYDPRIWPWIEVHHEIDWEDACLRQFREQRFAPNASTCLSSTKTTDGGIGSALNPPVMPDTSQFLAQLLLIRHTTDAKT